MLTYDLIEFLQCLRKVTAGDQQAYQPQPNGGILWIFGQRFAQHGHRLGGLSLALVKSSQFEVNRIEIGTPLQQIAIDLLGPAGQADFPVDPCQSQAS